MGTLKEEIKRDLIKLEQTALEPKMFTDREFYEQVIQIEEENKLEGWTERVEHIRHVMRKQ